MFFDVGNIAILLRFALLCVAPESSQPDPSIECRTHVPEYFQLHLLQNLSQQGGKVPRAAVSTLEMWQAVLLTVLAAAGNNIGKVLQKKGTRGLPRLSLDRKVLIAYLSNSTWVAGLVIDVSGALLMLEAVAQAPVSVVQPVSGCGLAILAVFSHFYLHEAMYARDWIGVALAAAGTIGVGMTGEDDKESTETVSLLRLFMFVFWLAVLLGMLEWWAQDFKIRRKAHEQSSPITPLLAGHADVMEEVATGTQAGAFFGMSAASCKTGFMLASRGYSKLFAPLGIAIGVSLSSSGFFCQNRGFKEGRAVVVSTCAAVASILTGVLVGMVALGETLPRSPFARGIRLTSWGLIVAGIVILVNAACEGRAGDFDDDSSAPSFPPTIAPQEPLARDNCPQEDLNGITALS